MENALDIQNLSIAFEGHSRASHVIEDVSLQLAPGRTLGLVGESGSGKSTIGLAILGLLPNSAKIKAGTIEFFGEEILQLPPEEKRKMRGDRISMVFQDPFTSLNPALTIGHQIAEGLMFHQGMTATAARQRTLGLLEEVRIPRAHSVIDNYPHQLSGGMKQRVLIAAALACKPSLLLLDEPTTALDVTNEAQIIDLLRNLKAEYSLSIVFISHNLHLVSQFCDDLAVLYAGTVVESGDAKSILRTPQHPYTERLLAAAPSLSHPKDRLQTIPGTLPNLDPRPAGCIFLPRCSHAEGRCSEPQHLVAGPRGSVRCWKSGVLKFGEIIESHPEPERPARDDILLEVSGLKKIYKSKQDNWLSRLFSPKGTAAPRPFHSLDGISLIAPRGEVLGVLGESGSGKTTLAQCIVGLVEPSEGSIRTFDAKGSKVSLDKRSIQMVFQNPASSLNPRRTIGDAIARPLVLNKYGDAAKRKQRVRELLELVQLPAGHIDRYPRQLSGGERQRVGIARALAASPQMIICDEPVSALDVSVQASILNLLDDLRRELDISYLFISHDISVVAHLADRIVIMFAGRIVTQGSAKALLEGPYHPYTQELLASFNAGTLASKSVSPATNPGDGCKFFSRCAFRMPGVCDRIVPPLVSLSPDLEIACHLDKDALPTPPTGAGISFERETTAIAASRG